MNKTKIFSLAFLTMAMSLVVSCTDALEEKVYSELLSTNAYETESDADALILSVYGGLWGTGWGTYYAYDYLLVSEAGTDTYGIDAWQPGEEKLEVGIWDNNYKFINSLWNGAYSVIGSANFALKILEGMQIDEDVKNKYIGEAKFLRGLAYHDLGFNFKEAILNIGESTGNLPLSSQESIIAQAIADFTDAAARLGESDTPGIASKGAALGLRAKTNLNAKNWAAAAADAKAVMDLGEYTLMSSVSDVFHNSNNRASEWIFAQMGVQVSPGPYGPIAWHTLGLNYVRGDWGRLTISPEFYNSFDLDDDRRSLLANGYQHADRRTDENGLPIYYALPGTPEYPILAADPTISLSDLNSVSSSKFLAGHDRFTHKPSRTGSNYPILRFADIILTRAEALNEMGNVGEAMSLVNEIRDRSNVAPLTGLDQNTLRDAILEERAKELFQEGHRRLDLIRSGKYIDLWRTNLETKYPGSNFGYLNQDKILFSVPQSEIDANDLIGN